jgi:hypothetical protein
MKNVLSMPWALHPALTHLFDFRNAGSVFGDIFRQEPPETSCSPSNAVAHSLPFQIMMVKITIARHVQAVIAGGLLKLRVQLQGSQATEPPKTVDFGEDSLLAAGLQTQPTEGWSNTLFSLGKNFILQAAHSKPGQGENKTEDNIAERTRELSF